MNQSIEQNTVLYRCGQELMNQSIEQNTVLYRCGQELMNQSIEQNTVLCHHRLQLHCCHTTWGMRFIFSVPNFGCCLSCTSRMKSHLHSLVCFSSGLCGACVPKNKWLLRGSFCYGFTVPALLCSWIFVYSSVWLVRLCFVTWILPLVPSLKSLLF